MVRIEDSVITAQVLQDKLGNEQQVEICPRATLTPSAHDFLRERSIEIFQREGTSKGSVTADLSASVNSSRNGNKRDFSGVFCPNIVIFDENDKINYGEMERYVNWLIDAGIHGLYPNGSTGEFVRLSWEERQEVVRLITEVNAGRVPILAGASEANLRDVMRMAEFYAKIGVDAISLVPPFYYKISDESLFQYFAEVAQESPLDILLYNIPQFTQELPLELMERLLPYERIFGTKDSSRDLPRLINTMHRLRAQRPDYVVLVGCEEILFPSILMGASGGTIATSGIVPEVIVDLYNKALKGDIENARTLQYRILDLINIMLLGVNFPEGFKTGVAVRGFDVGPARTSSSKEEQEHLFKVESQIGCLLSDMGYSVRGARACPVTNMPPIVRR
tara:strand:+ start:4576 stop:5751 length:1176 start_codon:yes stop_codon:yes gene_type:complete